MSEGVSFTPQAAAKIVAAVRRQGQQGLEPNYPEKQPIQRSHYGPYIAIAQEDIDPNTSGSIKLAAGDTKGSETAYGDAFDAYFRAKGTSVDKISSGDYLKATWISGGWEVKPLGFLPRLTRLAITQASIAVNTSGNCKFATGAKGSESASGSNVSMYWRTTGTKPIPISTLCYTTWVDDGAGHSGWELDPVGCL